MDERHSTGTFFFAFTSPCLPTRSEYLISCIQGPPLGTLWVYAIVQLNLLPTFLSLGLVAWAVKLLKLKVVF